MRWCFVMAHGMPKNEIIMATITLVVLFSLFILATLENARFVAPKVYAEGEGVYFEAHYESRNELSTHWARSYGRKQINATHSEAYDGSWTIEVPSQSEFDGDLALVMKPNGRHYAIASRFTKPYHLTNHSDIVLQFEAAADSNIVCGGAHVKLFAHLPSNDLTSYSDRSHYAILFGPEKCNDNYQMQFKLRLPSSQQSDQSAKKCPLEMQFDHSTIYSYRSRKSVNKQLQRLFSDRKFHLYTLVLRQSNERSFEIYVDHQLFHSAPLSSLKLVSGQSENGDECVISSEHDLWAMAIDSIAIESVNEARSIAFDNFLVTDSRLVADEYARATWMQKRLLTESRSDSYSSLVYYTVVRTNEDMPWLGTIIPTCIMVFAYYYFCLRPVDLLAAEEDSLCKLRTMRLRAAAAAAATVQPITILKAAATDINANLTASPKPSGRRVRFADESQATDSTFAQSDCQTRLQFAYALHTSADASNAVAT